MDGARRPSRVPRHAHWRRAEPRGDREGGLLYTPAHAVYALGVTDFVAMDVRIPRDLSWLVVILSARSVPGRLRGLGGMTGPASRQQRGVASGRWLAAGGGGCGSGIPALALGALLIVCVGGLLGGMPSPRAGMVPGTLLVAPPSTSANADVAASDDPRHRPGARCMRSTAREAEITYQPQKEMVVGVSEQVEAVATVGAAAPPSSLLGDEPRGAGSRTARLRRRGRVSPASTWSRRATWTPGEVHFVAGSKASLNRRPPKSEREWAFARGSR